MNARLTVLCVWFACRRWVTTGSSTVVPPAAMSATSGPSALWTGKFVAQTGFIEPFAKQLGLAGFSSAAGVGSRTTPSEVGKDKSC